MWGAGAFTMDCKLRAQHLPGLTQQSIAGLCRGQALSLSPGRLPDDAQTPRVSCQALC